MKQHKQLLVGYYHYGVILTYLSVAAAIVGICFSVGGNLEPRPGIGIICLIISGICDSFDGIVARTRKDRTREDKMFGCRIDSLSDLIAFGVAPAMVGFGMDIDRWFFIPVYAIFVLCALIRLAYFDVEEDIRQEDPNCGKREHYIGMPVTSVAFALPVIYLFATLFTNHLVQTIIMSSGYLLMAIFMVARFKTRKFGVRGIITAFLVLALLCGTLGALHLSGISI